MTQGKVEKEKELSAMCVCVGGGGAKMYGRSGPSDKKGNAALCATQPLLAEGIYFNMLSHSALLASARSARCKDLKYQVQIIL